MHDMLASLPFLREFRSRRASSFDRTGGNRDWVDVEPGQRKTLAEIDGPGVIRHIWMTMGFPQDDYLRRVILRMYWDGCRQPSVECPIGDFFGLGHAKRKNFVTAVLSMSPQDGRACNSWWPMPFREHARIEVENHGNSRYSHYYYIDYESNAPSPKRRTSKRTPSTRSRARGAAGELAEQAYFHVQWRRENPTAGWGDEYNHLVAEGLAPGAALEAEHRFLEPRPQEWFDKLWFGGDPRSLNAGATAAENYIILAAAGNGIYCGAHLDIDVFARQKNDWYGEGDDMTFLDDDLTDDFDATAWAAMREKSEVRSQKSETQSISKRLGRAVRNTSRKSKIESRKSLANQLRWPPSLHGTGTEDWNHCAFGPSEEYHAPYHGVLLYSGDDKWRWRGKQSIYRYCIADPIRFRKRILATIEHGHANKLSNDYSSTAYYYLDRPARGGPPLPDVEKRLPRADG